MTLSQLLQTLKSLEALKGSGGKQYAQIAKLLESEATTHNCSQARLLLAKLSTNPQSS